mmetsp:Transcript_16366/g.25862  ORF Transcript_16366/g.25862 Transcript_16366/m.25862 type:complete len:351 (-) Transcript_16366:916-1968(-)
MGCCSSHSVESQKWDKEILKDKVAASKVHKLLLLGTGNSGKSTFFKQLTQIHGGGFQDDEFMAASKHIQDSIIIQMKHLLQTFKSTESDEWKADLPAELLESAKKVITLSPEQPLSVVADDIECLWGHEAIKQAYSNRSNLGIADSAPHFLDDLERIRAPNYRPTPTDILLARIPTTGMRDKKFTISGSVFNIFDVGGQRSERNKWIHCFDTVHGILFVASLSCYDQNLFEDNELNAMDEALELFDIVVNSRYFLQASMMLFLNKCDLFAQKIKVKPLTICFPEYDGDNQYDDCIEYITERFKQQMTSKRDAKSLYTHVTCATDRNNVKKVFDDVQHAVVTNALKHNGLI